MARYQCWDRGASLKEALPESGIQSFFVMLSALNKLIGWPKGTSATTCVAMFARVINRGKYTYPLQTTTQLSMFSHKLPIVSIFSLKLPKHVNVSPKTNIKTKMTINFFNKTKMFL
jgi:hypothetical protein